MLVYAASLERQSENGIMYETTLKGSCLCGAVKYEATGEPARFYHCHCSRCRKATGTGHATNLFLQPGLLKWVCGEEQVRSFKVPEAKRFTNFFCATCGSRLPRQGRDPDLVMIPAGSLDQEAPIKPQARIFSGSRTRWSCEGDSVPTYSDYPPQ
ncbi:MAG: GFA family protein [Burkholderiales bacterium]